MSTTVDERVVEMRFDNGQFENGVKTTMSTLDKFKQKLNLTGASKGLEDISSAAKKVDMSGVGKAVETVHAKFSALQVVGVTALANITNSAINAGKRMVSALTIDPIMSGYQEYETQIGSIQTILANTQKEGTNVERVNAALDELNLYADKTIYNFTEMTRNIGTFTAAGVKLDTSVSAIKGIANLAAVSGSTSQQASTAMYQLSQALAAGKVQLMDWNSVVNAGMGGQVFQDALIRTSENLKTGAKEAIKTAGSFRESLTKSGWLTSEVLTETLNQIAGEYSKAELMAKGYTEAQAEEITKLAATAESAATEVKTFSQLWDTLKEAAQSGWGQTWRLIIGDFEKAKERMTELSKLFSNIIGKSSDSRNNFLDKVLTSKWDQLTSKLNDAGIKTEDFQNRVKKLAKSHNVDLDAMIKKEGSFEKALMKAFKSGKLDKSIISDAIKSFVGNITGATKSTEKAADQMEKYGKIVNKVINGDFGNGKERIEKLTKAGYDYATIQNLVNKKLGSNVQHLSSLSKEQIKNADSLSKLSDKQLKSKGYTEKQITALRGLAEAADKSGSEINDLINDIEKPSGAELIWDSFTNVLHSIIKPLQAVGKAWKEVFPKDPEGTYAAIEAVNAFTVALKKFTTNKKRLDELTRTFKGLFAVIDIVTTIAGGGLKFAIKAVAKALGLFNVDILKNTANIGDAIVKFRDWLFENNAIAKSFDKLMDKIPGAIEAVKTFIKSLADIPIVKDIIDSVKNIDLSEIGSNIIAGLKNGLSDGITAIPELLIEIGTKLLNAIKGVLGIHSPSTEFYDIGTNIIAGLVNGISAGIKFVVDIIKKLASSTVDAIGDFSISDVLDNIGKALSNFGSKAKETFGDPIVDMFSNAKDAISNVASKIKDVIIGIPFDKIFAIGISVSVIASIKKLADALTILGKPLEGLGSIFENAGKILEVTSKGLDKCFTNFAKTIKAFTFSIRAKAIRNIAISIAILVGSLALLTFLDTGKLYKSIGIIAILSGILLGLSYAIDKMSSAAVTINRGGASIKSVASTLIGIGMSLVLMALTVKLIGSLNPEQAKQGFLGLTGLVLALVGVMAAYGLLVKGKSAQNIDKLGKMLRKLSVTLLILVVVVKLIGKLTLEEMVKGGIFMLAFVNFVASLSLISQCIGKNIDKLGGTILKLSLALILLVGVVKLIGKLTPGEMIKGGVFITAFTVFVWALSNISTLVGRRIGQLGKTLLGISAAMLLIALTVKLIGTTPWFHLVKGLIGVTAFTGIIYILVQAIESLGPDTPKIAATILAMSVAIGILAAVAVMLSLIDLGGLAKGVAAVSVLGMVMAGMIKATKGASNCKSNLIVMTVAIGVMAASVAALSMIDGSKLAGATIALSILMGMFALIEKMGSNIESSIGPLITMTITVGLLAGVIYLIAQLPIESALSSSASLSMLLLSFSVAMKVLSGMGTVTPLALVSVGVMLLVVGALALIISKLSSIDPSSSLSAVKALSLLLLAMSGAMLVLSGIGLLGPAAFIGIAALATFIVGIGGLIVGIGALVDKFPKLQEFLDKGIPVLEKIGHALGSFFGNIVSGFATGVSSGFPQIGKDLSSFMIAIQPFIDGAKTIDETALNGVSSLAKMIALISGANILESISSRLTGSSSMETFGQQINAFGDAIISFSNKVKGNIDESAVTAAANAGKLLAEMSDSLPRTGGVLQYFAGEKDFANFGAQLMSFGTALVSFSSTVKGKIDEKAISAAANAGNIMATLQDKVAPTGGVLQFFTGEKDLSTFAIQLTAFGKAIVGFSKSVDGKIDEKAVQAAADAGAVMSKMQSDLEPTGGVINFFTGDKKLDDFGVQIKKFGEAIAGFSKKVSGKIDAASVSAAANFGKSMAGVQKEIPKNTIGDGKSSLSSFGKQIEKFGGYISGYASNIASVNFGSVNSSVNAAKSLVKLVKSTSGVDASGAKAFKDAINALSKADVGGFSKKFSGKNTNLSSAGVNAINSLIKGMKSKQSSLNLTATSMISSMVKSINSKKGAFEDSAVKLMKYFAEGIKSQSEKAKSAFSSVVRETVSGINRFKSNCYSSGQDLGTGYVNGIKSKTTAAYNAGYKLGQKGAKGVHDGEKAGSPSKLAIQDGKWLGEGYVIGINSMIRKVYKTGYGMGQTATKSIEEAISKASSMIDGGVDVRPTIRPVIDLSNVEKGAKSINGMFGITPSLKVLSNIGAIDVRNNQNGGNDDVVSAIESLRKDLGNLGGDTYTINGITYDDGSNVSDAIRTLIRATKIERRM